MALSVVALLVPVCFTPCPFLLLVLVITGDVGARSDFTGTWVGTGGTVTGGLFLGATGAEFVAVCWSTAVWLTYGVGGIVACGVWGDGVHTELVLEGTDPCCVACPHGKNSLLFEDCGPVEPGLRFERGSKIDRSSGRNGDTIE